MELEKRIKAFEQLGTFLKNFLLRYNEENFTDREKELLVLVNTGRNTNGWFDKENVLSAIEALANTLTQDSLNTWLKKYDAKKLNPDQPKRVLVVMAGNIPLVGFHDMMCVLISGHRFVGKTSSQDPLLMPFLGKMLIEIEPEFADSIIFVPRAIDYDVVIATGSNNTARYFEYYFGTKPHIIRKNRNSVAIITGKETKEEITELGKDIFKYFGLGCRNISKIYFPKGFDKHSFFEPLEGYAPIANNHKYANNYDYNKAIYLLNKENFFDNGFLMIRENEGLSSPVSVVHFEEYTDLNEVKEKIALISDNIQCIVGKGDEYIPFGKTQEPKLWDYADGVDTIEFLMEQ